MAKFEIDYDKEFDDLYLYRKEKKAEFNLNIGNFVIDATKNGQIIGVEVLEASNTLADILGSDLGKNTLATLSDASVHVSTSGNSLVVSIILKPQSEKELRVPLVLPAIISK